ncbi:hypothetical protein K5X82_07755 [Halosquirtibacter xylanolyticus]|uniref:hypothetical protein n=1 Tax=Halosquirtibacter xylanolyticus TaxID=3374599 RepID=UPI0037496360|nr:hypothetical protein K5X82_07755 [Prolixibacteraceae bacterium]
MKKLNVLFILFITLFSCSKEKEFITPKMPGSLFGFYKLVGIQNDPHMSDNNRDGKIEDMYTEYTTGPFNLFRVNESVNFLSISQDYDGTKFSDDYFTFSFTSPGQLEDIHPVSSPSYLPVFRLWYTTASSDLNYDYADKTKLSFKRIGQKEASQNKYGSIYEITCKNSIVFITIYSYYYNQEKDRADLIPITLIYKHLGDDYTKVIEVAKTVKLEPGDID